MSTVRSEPLHEPKARPRPRVSWNKAAAVVAWLIGTFTTWLFFAKAAPELTWLLTLPFAAIVQWLLTLAERPLWRFILRRRGGKFVLLAFVLTFFDGLLNAGGIYSYVGRIAKTDVGAMLAEVLNVAPTIEPRSAFLVALFLGMVIAGLPEALWEYDEKG